MKQINMNYNYLSKQNIIIQYKMKANNNKNQFKLIPNILFKINQHKIKFN